MSSPVNDHVQQTDLCDAHNLQRRRVFDAELTPRDKAVSNRHTLVSALCLFCLGQDDRVCNLNSDPYLLVLTNHRAASSELKNTKVL